MLSAFGKCVGLAAGFVPAAVIAAAAAPQEAAAVAQDPSAQLDELSDAYDKAYEDLYAELDKLDGEKVPRDELYKQFEAGRTEIDTSFQAKFDDVAKTASDYIAPKALVWVFRLSATGGAKTPECEARSARAFELLATKHVGSDALDKLAEVLMQADPQRAEYDEALRKIRAGSPHRLVQASALHALAERAYARGIDDEAKRTEVRKLFAELKSEFGSLGSNRGKSFGKLADGILYEIDNLQVGMPVPDVEATDETGAKFKLSDYRGKVVVVDFWGFW